mgnify:CR=1 FL=1
MRNDLHANLTVRIFTDRKCFGPGVAELLRRVRELHSLTAEGERLLAAYEDYCAKLTAYGETLFAETFAFYDTLTEEKPE